MDEAAATLPDIVRADAPAYARALVARFENPHLQHRLRQIAMDGSQKLPIRILGTLRDRKARGMASPACEATLDAWASFLAAELETGRVVRRSRCRPARGGAGGRRVGARAPRTRGRDVLTAGAPSQKCFASRRKADGVTPALRLNQREK